MSKAIVELCMSFDGFIAYVYELEGDILTIWGGEKGSPAYYRGEFTGDGNTIQGAWVWPGGGYQATLIRIEDGRSSKEIG